MPGANVVTFFAPKPVLRRVFFGRGITLKPAGGTTEDGTGEAACWGFETTDPGGETAVEDRASPHAAAAPAETGACSPTLADPLTWAAVVGAFIVGALGGASVVFDLRARGGWRLVVAPDVRTLHETALEALGALRPLM